MPYPSIHLSISVAMLLAIVIGIAHAFGYSNDSTTKLVIFYRIHTKTIYMGVLLCLCSICANWYLKRKKPVGHNYPLDIKKVKSKHSLIITTILFFGTVCGSMGAIVTLTAAYDAWQVAYLEKHGQLAEQRAELSAKVKHCQMDAELMETFLCRSRMEDQTRQNITNDDATCHQYAWESVFRVPMEILQVLPFYSYLEAPMLAILACVIMSTHYIRASLILLVGVGCGFVAVMLSVLHWCLIVSGERLLEDIHHHVAHQQRLRMAATSKFAPSSSSIMGEESISTSVPQRLDSSLQQSLTTKGISGTDEDIKRLLETIQHELNAIEQADGVSGASTA